MMGHAPAEADVHAVVMRTANRLLVTNACELSLGRPRCRKSVQRSCTASSTHGYALIDIDGLVLVQTKNVRVFRFDYRIRIEQPAIARVEFFSYRVAIVGIHQASDTARRKLCGRRRNRRKRADAILPLAKGKARTWNRVARARKAEHRCKDCRVAHLFHKQRNVLEHIAKVKPESPTQYVLASASHVVGEADSRAEVLVVVMRQFADEGKIGRAH